MSYTTQSKAYGEPIDFKTKKDCLKYIYSYLTKHPYSEWDFTIFKSGKPVVDCEVFRRGKNIIYRDIPYYRSVDPEYIVKRDGSKVKL